MLLGQQHVLYISCTVSTVLHTPVLAPCRVYYSMYSPRPTQAEYTVHYTLYCTTGNYRVP